MNWYFENPYYLFLLLLLPLLAVLLLYYFRWKNNRKELFAEKRFQEGLFEKKSFFSKIFPLFYLLAVLFLILSLADIMKGNEEIETQQKVSNIMFLLDVSNSMNAEDIEPSRLNEAKNIIINTMSHLKNDRVGIVIFAGNATSIMPLTTDYTAAETYLEGIETSVIKTQGTDFLEAMKVVASKFKNISKGSRKVVIVSDGEDNEGNMDAAVKLAKEEGISVTSVGVGTEQGSPIPEYLAGQLMGYKTNEMGETVISKREDNALKSIATETNGQYIDGNNLDNAVQKLSSQLNSDRSGTLQKVKSFVGIHYYQYTLAISLFFFLIIYFFNPKHDLNT